MPKKPSSVELNSKCPILYLSLLMTGSPHNPNDKDTLQSYLSCTQGIHLEIDTMLLPHVDYRHCMYQTNHHFSGKQILLKEGLNSFLVIQGLSDKRQK